MSRRQQVPRSCSRARPGSTTDERPCRCSGAWASPGRCFRTISSSAHGCWSRRSERATPTRSRSLTRSRRKSRRGDGMDLTYSHDDEHFRVEVRSWLEAEVPRHGSPPPPGDWTARRAYDTAWQRKLYDAGYAGLQWPAAFGGRGLPATQQLVYLEEYARANAPYISVNFVGMMHA